MSLSSSSGSLYTNSSILRDTDISYQNYVTHDWCEGFTLIQQVNETITNALQYDKFLFLTLLPFSEGFTQLKHIILPLVEIIY